MKYIVFDLEWNQGDGTKTVSTLPFEIIELGAVKYNDRMEMISSFHEVIRPRVYPEMHYITKQLMHIQKQELRSGRSFVWVMRKFLAWCGEEDRIFCTWGPADLTELQRNMKYYGMEPLAEGPIPYLDVQKLYSIAAEERKTRRALETVVDTLEIPKDIPFHRAFSDAYYTGKVLARIYTPDLAGNLSYDVFHPPVNREGELKLQFDTYAKFISRQFSNKEEAFHDPEVVSSKCYLCHRNLKKLMPWFAMNHHQYYCLAYCDVHGHLKGKIRLRTTDDGMTFVVKTTKLISREDAEKLLKQKEHVKEMRRKHQHLKHTAPAITDENNTSINEEEDA